MLCHSGFFVSFVVQVHCIIRFFINLCKHFTLPDAVLTNILATGRILMLMQSPLEEALFGEVLEEEETGLGREVGRH